MPTASEKRMSASLQLLKTRAFAQHVRSMNRGAADSFMMGFGAQ
jgi:hypothetical protein